MRPCRRLHPFAADTHPDNTEIRSDDYSTLNGKKIGVNKDSIQSRFYRDWAAQHKVDADLIELVCDEDESIDMLRTGELDAYITPDAFSDPEKLVPVCKIGTSDFYFLKTASRLICRIFQHSPVFRIGGDEFSVLLQNEDYENREALAKSFDSEAEHINASAANAWEEVRITMGTSTYEPGSDRAVIDTVRRADKDMYENKRARKAERGE